MDWSAVRLVAFDSVLHGFSRPEVAIRHAIELFEHSCKYFANREVLIGYHEVLQSTGVRFFG